MAEDAKPQRRLKREAMPDSSSAVDIAMGAAASGKALPEIARRVLEEQAELLHAQTAELKLRHVGNSVRAVLWGILAVLALGLLVLIGAIVVRASRTDALIVQSFRVPPTMQAKGLTGEVVATQLLDRLAEMQEQSESTRAASSYANNWENDLKIDIPNTGATAEQVWKLLRGWLGKETRISGEVIETPGGLALTARVGSQPGRRFVNKEGDLDALVTQGAELIYARTQPYRHAISLDAPERRAERLAALTQLTRHESAMERKWAYSGLSVTLRSEGDFRGAVAMAQKALAIDPDMYPAIGNLGAAHRLLGHEKQMVDLYRHWSTLKVGKEYDARIVAANGCNQQTDLGQTLRNPVMLDNAADCHETTASSMSTRAPSTRVDAALMRNDPRMALAFSQKAEGGLTPVEAAFATAATRLDGEMVRGPSPALAKALADYRAARDKRNAEAAGRNYYVATRPTLGWPREARAVAMLGRTDEAAALIARTPLDCYECVRVRGVVAEARGDRRVAQLHYLAAAKLGPRLPAVFADWGRLLAKAGRHASAEVKLREAVRLAPNWPDPLKTWGDMLAAQGKRTDALAKYDAALKLAPNWQQLRLARAKVAR